MIYKIPEFRIPSNQIITLLLSLSLTFLFLPPQSHAIPITHPHPHPHHRLSPRKNITLGVSFDSPSLRTSLEAMLHLIDSTAHTRFVKISRQSTFGLANAIESNAALSSLVDKTFTPTSPSSTSTINTRWSDTYIDFLIDFSDGLPDLPEQDAIIDAYYEAMKNLAGAQAALVKAYTEVNDGGDGVVTNIGVKLPGSSENLEPLSIGIVEEWAEGQFGLGGGRGQGGQGQGQGGLTEGEYEEYLKAKAALDKVTGPYQQIKQENMIASQGYILQNLIPTYPGILGLSMIYGGTPNTPQAKYTAAWSATIINTTSIDTEDVGALQGNLDGNERNSTVDDTLMAKSFSGNRPVATSTAKAKAKAAVSTPKPGSGSKSSTSSTGSRSSVSTPTPGKNTHKRRIPRRGITIVSPSTKTHLTPRASSTKSSNAISNALKLAAQSQSQNKNSGGSKSVVSGSISGTSGGMNLNGSKNRVASLPSNPSNPSNPIFSSPSISSSSSSSSSANTIVDPLSTIPDTPLKGTMELIEISPGTWMNNMTEYISYAVDTRPDLVGKYFGGATSASASGSVGVGGDVGVGVGGGGWNGPLGKIWTHMVIVTTYEDDSDDVQTVWIVGLVYDVLPALKGLSVQA